MSNTPRVAFKDTDDEDSVAEAEGKVDEDGETGDVVDEDDIEDSVDKLPDSSISHVEYSTNKRPSPPDPLKLLKDTLEMLNISTLTMTEDDSILLFRNVQSLGREKYKNKTILGHENALSKLLVLLTKYNSNHLLVVEGCKALSQMTINDTDNKKILGSENACQELVTVISLHGDKLDVLVHCFDLVVNLCNSTFQYKLPSLSPIHRPNTEINPLDFQTCNNRINFMNAKLFPLILSAMMAVNNASSTTVVHTTPSHKVNTHHTHETLILVTCRMISTLAENDMVSKALGEAEMCGVVTKLMSLNKHTEIVCAASYALIVLCSDNKAGNKMRFNMFGVLHVIIANLKEYIMGVAKYSVTSDFNILMERLCWALASLTLSCPKNVSDLRSQHQSKEILETLMGCKDIKESAKQKAMVVFKRVYPQ